MKSLTFLLLLTSLTLSGQTDKYKDWVLTQRLPKWTIRAVLDLKINENYQISDYINPFYLEADFNGDNELDIAITINQRGTNKKGIVIIHKKINNFFVLGAGVKFGNGGDDFNWMDIWKVNRSLVVNELTYDNVSEITGSKELKIKHPGLDVEKSESAGGLIYWDGEKYKWVQTSD